MTPQWLRDPPDWNPPARVEFLLTGGAVAVGSFVLDEAGFSGEESYPCWSVKLEDGRALSFWDDVEGWRASPQLRHAEGAQGGKAHADQ